MKNIVVALDFSPIANILVSRASEQAKLYDAKVWLIHVAAPDPDFVGYGVGPTYIRDDRAEALKVEHGILSDYKAMLLKEEVDAEALLIQGPTVETLLDELEKLDADLLVIGKKGHSVLYKAFVGSVFNEILKEVQIPILAIPGTG